MRYACFNPRAREGRDCCRLRDAAGRVVVSIHAPVRGATNAVHGHGDHQRRFNPRAREGRDWTADASAREPRVFQSTRPCGARRPCAQRCLRSGVVSIHAPVGARRLAGASNCRVGLFQSTRPWGATCSVAADGRGYRTFQSTRPCGARLA